MFKAKQKEKECPVCKRALKHLNVTNAERHVEKCRRKLNEAGAGTGGITSTPPTRTLLNFFTCSKASKDERCPSPKRVCADRANDDVRLIHASPASPSTSLASVDLTLEDPEHEDGNPNPAAADGFLSPDSGIFSPPPQLPPSPTTAHNFDASEVVEMTRSPEENPSDAGLNRAQAHDMDIGVSDDDSGSGGGSFTTSEGLNRIKFPTDPAHYCDQATFTEAEVQKFVEGVTCQPKARELPQGFPRDDKGCRFLEAWYTRTNASRQCVNREWLQYSPSLDKAFCSTCIVFGNRDDQARRNNPFVKGGFNNWRKGAVKILAHETSLSHNEANIRRAERQVTAPICPSIEAAKKAEVQRNREIVKHLLEITLYLARHNMAFRGHRENNSSTLQGNFRDLVTLVGKFSQRLASYLSSLELKNKKKKKNKISLISNKRQNQLLHSLATCVTSEILKEINDAMFWSVQMDGAFDSSKHEQLAFTVRYANRKTGEVFERLLAIRPTSSGSGEALFTIFCEICEALGLDWRRYLVGQAYDGAMNMRGDVKGLQGRIRQVNPSALYIWCHAHRLNLVVKEAVENKTGAKEFFGKLEQVYDFIGNCKQRVKLFEKYQKQRYPEQRPRRVKRARTTRWFSHSAALDTVIETYDAVLDTLADVRDIPGLAESEAKAVAGGLYDFFFSEKFIISAVIFHEPIEDPYFKMKVEVFISTLNVVSMQMRTIFSQESLGLMRDISLFTRRRMSEVRQNPESLPEDAFTHLASSYPGFINKENLLTEYKTFVNTYNEFEKDHNLPKHLHTENNYDSSSDSEGSSSESEDEVTGEETRTELRNAGSLMGVFKVFCINDMKEIFPTVELALTIAVTLPVSSVTPERAFSKLKLIKTRLRSTMSDSRLEHLMILSMEHDIPIDFDKVIELLAGIGGDIIKQMLT